MWKKHSGCLYWCGRGKVLGMKGCYVSWYKQKWSTYRALNLIIPQKSKWKKLCIKRLRSDKCHCSNSKWYSAVYTECHLCGIHCCLVIWLMSSLQSKWCKRGKKKHGEVIVCGSYACLMISWHASNETTDDVLYISSQIWTRTSLISCSHL